MSPRRVLGILSLAIVVVAISCPLFDAASDPSLQILSPTSSWVYYDDSPILFQVNILNEEVQWALDADGRSTFSGNGRTRILGAGDHEVVARYGDQSTILRFPVQHRTQLPLDERRYLIVSPDAIYTFPQGGQYPAILTLDGYADDISILHEESEGSASPNGKGFDGGEPQIHDIRIPLAGNGLIPSLSAVRKSKELSESRTFRVINTANQMGEAHEIVAMEFHEGASYRLWKPSEVTIGQATLDRFIDNLDTLVLPRVRAIWGDWIDIDQDGKIAILFSPTINEEELAIGFFNPNDFFARDTDLPSDHYNPNSNEMDILYVAVPSDANPSYAVEAILATIGHELTHAVTFSQKTWKRLYQGETDAAQAEVFLDEGWSHLSENLLGFGIRGGNIRFLERYLSAPSSYSFASTTDSVGARGATMLFLSWLFWKQGGMAWDTAGNIVDTGGIAFLRRMLASEYTGWEAIGHAYGQGETSDSLLQQLCYRLNRQRAMTEAFAYTVDPITRQPVEIFSSMGTLDDVVIGEPSCVPYGRQIRQLPSYIFCFLPPTYENQTYALRADKVQGTVFFSAVREADE